MINQHWRQSHTDSDSQMDTSRPPEVYEQLELETVVGAVASPRLPFIPINKGQVPPKPMPGKVSTDKELHKAVKFDAGKTDWSLVPWDSVEEIVKVLEFGKVKYAAWNWSSNGGFKYMRVFNSTMRHLLAWARGEDKDPESGLSHIAHAGCNIFFLMHFIKNKDKFSSNDDRNV